MKYSFAERVLPLSQEGAYAVLAKAKAMESEGRDIIHLEIGQPDFPTPSFITHAGTEAINNGRTNYTSPAGTMELRKVIAESAGDQRGITLSPEQVIVGPGAKPALFYTVMALVEPGDQVIIPDPGFPSYEAIVLLAGGQPVPVKLDKDGLYNFDLDDLKAKINSRTRLVILNSPSNPTGGVAPISVLEKIAELIKNVDGCWVVSDEIYSKLVYEGNAPSIAVIPGMPERTVIVDGFSKTYSMTGWRLGYGIMPVALAERMELLLTHSVGCTADFTQAAGVAALLGDQSAVDTMRASFRKRRDLTVTALNSIPGVKCAVPPGAFYLFPDVSSFRLKSRKIADYLLSEAGVALLAGSDFGNSGEGYLRISYATSLEYLEEAVERIRTALARL